MARWFEHALNMQHVERLRTSVKDGGRLLVFLGSGLSFGAARQTGRARFDNEHWGTDPGGPGYRRRPYDYPYGPDWGPPFPPHPPYAEIALDDDGLPLPSWPWLISRMRGELAQRCHQDEQESLSKFFRDEGPLDCAELFRQTVGEANYREFLQTQFGGRRHEFVRPTPSHEALVALGLALIYTTNYDELIEDAYLDAGLPIRVSADEAGFKAHAAQHPQRHLVKLHGSIDRPDTIVLTRNDYSRARSSRREMLGHLRHELANASFLFVGFSLSDPNFNLLHDEIRESLGMLAPVSYTVQG
ncbi:MAG: SIR2 family protein, partial [Actinobacteria bacterium]|nr:SIR2 family protein [Actinomycetota bacterium]